MVATILLSNRTDQYLSGALASLSYRAGVTDPIIVDDSGDAQWRSQLREEGFTVHAVDEHMAAGYIRAMQKVWEIAAQHEFVFLFEEDFVLTRDIDLGNLADNLRFNDEIAQFVLLRQPWFGNEIAAGGLIPALEQHGHVFNEVPEGPWIEHVATWSCNPTVFRGGDWVRERPWPEQIGSEAEFGRRVFAEGMVAAYWGNGEEWCEHVGIRSGFDY